MRKRRAGFTACLQMTHMLYYYITAAHQTSWHISYESGTRKFCWLTNPQKKNNGLMLEAAKVGK